jgi:glycine cleavage system H protein
MTIILFISTIIIFLATDHILQRKKVRSMVPVPAHVPSSPFRIPDGIFFSKSHTWLNLFPTGKVRLGLDDFILRMLKHPAIEFLKTAGSHVAKDEPILLIRDGARKLTIRSPLEGEINSCNDEITGDPEMARRLLFSNGWAYTITPLKVSELRSFLLGEESRSWFQGELTRLRDFFAGVYGATASPAFLQDGGTPVEGALTGVNDEQWKKFEEQFLTTL